jgi:hypothetical protein
VEAAGIEPASANAPSARLYERRSRFGFAFLDGPGRRRKASPLNVPYVPRARTRRVSPLNDTGEPGRGLPGPMGYLNLLSSQHHIIVGVYLFCRRFTSLQQTRLVSLDADRSRRSRYAPLTSDILPFWRGFSTAAPASYRRMRSFMARSISRLAVFLAISRRLSYCLLRLATAISSLRLPPLS